MDIKDLFKKNIRNPHAVVSILHHRGEFLSGANYNEKLKYVEKEIKREYSKNIN